MTMDDCVLLGKEGCVQYNADNPQYKFFCGFDKQCSIPKQPALQLAKFNIENYYSIVGVASKMNLTMAVLEAYLPRFFSGVTQVYGRYSLGSHIYNEVVQF